MSFTQLNTESLTTRVVSDGPIDTPPIHEAGLSVHTGLVLR